MTQDEQWTENKEKIDDQELRQCDECKKYFIPYNFKWQFCCEDCEERGEIISDEERGN